MIVQCIIELNSLCKHIKKVRSSQAAILVLNWIKHSFFWVSLNISFLASNIFYLFLFGALSLKHLVLSYYSNQIFIPTVFPANNGFGEDVFIKTNISVLVIRLQKTSSEDLLVKTNIFVLAMRLQDLFKTLWRRLKTASANGHIFVNLPSIRCRSSTWKDRGNHIDFERRIHVEIMTSIRRGFDFQNRRNIDEFSTWIFLCRFDVKLT